MIIEHRLSIPDIFAVDDDAYVSMRISFLTPPLPETAVKPPHMDGVDMVPLARLMPCSSSLRLKLSKVRSHLALLSHLADVLWMADIGRRPAMLGEWIVWSLYWETTRSCQDILFEKMDELRGHLTTAVPGRLRLPRLRTLLLLFTVLRMWTSPESFIGLNLSMLTL